MSKKNGNFNYIPLVSSDKSNSEKTNLIESAMINVGSLVTYIVSYGASKLYNSVLKCNKKIKAVIIPVQNNFNTIFKKKIKSLGAGVINGIENIARFNKSFAERIKTVGFGSALKLQISDIYSALKKNKSIFRTFVNYTVPLAAFAVLVVVVYNTASASYGIAVECNGKELGVVTAESVVNDAQKTIADRAVYYDTADEIFVTANLSIKPLNALDEVIDEVALADKLQDELADTVSLTALYDEGTEDNLAARTAEDLPEEKTSTAETTVDGKERAYAVVIDGKFVAAVENTDQISNFLESEKSKYLNGNVVSVEFDKGIEYDYEQYFLPSQIVEQDEIIDKLTSIVSEPVYYEVQQGDSPWNIASHNDLSLDELKNCFASYDGKQIDDITEECPVGTTIQLSAEVPYLQVMVTKNVTYTDSIDYEIIKTEDPDMYKGDSVVDVAGVEGEAEITALVTYKNDVPVTKEIISEKVISEPVAKEMRVGTRATSTAVSTGSGGSGTYFWPVDGGYISAYMGDRRGHKGIDIAAPYGTPIYAAESGTVTRAGNKYDGYGICVMISHSDGNTTVYAHMSSAAISNSEYVVTGQLIGYVGSTGDSTGNHCHFEVRSNGYYNDPCDYVSQY